MNALKRLDDQARRLEASARGPSFEAVVANERNRSIGYGGRSIFGWESELLDDGTARRAANLALLRFERCR
jgi:hypothetical protein